MPLSLDFARALGVFEALLLGFLCLVFVIFLRWVSRFPSELDRIGADISLYACGAAFSLFAAAFLEGSVLKGADQQDTLFLGTGGMLLSIMAYFASLFCSQSLRSHNNPGLPAGIEDWEDILSVVQDPHASRYLKASLALGLIPGTFFFMLDILRGLAP